jgi:hypothetical protein
VALVNVSRREAPIFTFRDVSQFPVSGNISLLNNIPFAFQQTFYLQTTSNVLGAFRKKRKRGKNPRGNISDHPVQVYMRRKSCSEFCSAQYSSYLTAEDARISRHYAF